MRAGRHFQPLSYDLRLPDGMQAAALQVLDGAREVINATVAALWDRLDDFGKRETKYAYKQVTALLGSPAFHGDRQWRCEFDGRQAHTRRHIDRLKSKVAALSARRDQFPVGDKRRAPSESKLVVLRREIACCWRKYEARNNDLAHLAANILILLAVVWEAELISGESLKSLKSEGRGRGARGRWVHWRNNAQIRGALWRTLRYKCHLSGLHLAWQHASGTTHTCPQCGQPANTYASPALDAPVLDAGPWLRCFACGWNGTRDYAAAINIALLGVAFLKQSLAAAQADPSPHPTMTEKGLNSESYSGSGLALRLPPTSPRGRLICSGKRYVNGWIKSVTLHSALPPESMLRLCG
jgi:putative transposase